MTLPDWYLEKRRLVEERFNLRPDVERAAGADRRLVAKRIGPGVTLALARRTDHQAEKEVGPKPGA